MSGGFLPYGRQTIEDDDVAAVVAALRGDLLTTGPRVEAYERAFAEATGAVHAVTCNSGTAALHLAVLAADVGPGDAVIVPSITFLATANVVRMTGAEVIFADVDAETGLLTADTLAAARARANPNDKVKAAIPVHLNGQVCDLMALSRTAGANGIRLIEDACHALGLQAVGRCDHSDFACFSTHPVKAIATGEGGVVTTRNEVAVHRMRSLRSHGMVRDESAMCQWDDAFEDGILKPWYYEMQEFGWNYRMPDILCALGLNQLRKLARFIERRREIAALYDRLLAPLSPVVKPVPHGGRAHAWHLYPVLIDFDAAGTSRAVLMRSLRAQGIGTQVHYFPVHRQPYYRRHNGDVSLPGAEMYYARCLSLPSFPQMTDHDVERVATALDRLVPKNAAA